MQIIQKCSKITCELQIIFTEGRKHRLEYYNGDVYGQGYLGLFKARNIFEQIKFVQKSPHYSLTPLLSLLIKLCSVQILCGLLHLAISTNTRRPDGIGKAIWLTPQANVHIGAVHLETAFSMSHSVA